ncbi:hypothetical protein ABK040_002528 [Willaertia magna]
MSAANNNNLKMKANESSDSTVEYYSSTFISVTDIVNNNLTFINNNNGDRTISSEEETIHISSITSERDQISIVNNQQLQQQPVTTKEQPLEKEEKPLFIYVLVHGLNGLKSDFQYIANQLTLLYTNENAFIINSELNEKKTHKGIEKLSQNLLFEVLKQLYEQQELKVVVKRKIYFSVVGHSLGGLIIRAMIKLLFFDLLDENSMLCKETFTKNTQNDFILYRNYYLQNIEPYIIPTSFLTLSTPHLGSRRPGGSLFKRSYRFLSHTFMKLCGKTGKELKFKDATILEECLLYKMSIPDSDFIKALLKFKYRTLVSAVHFDIIVPFPSSSIRSFNPYDVPAYGKHSFRIAGFCSRFDNDSYAPLFNKYCKKQQLMESEKKQQKQQQKKKKRNSVGDFVDNSNNEDVIEVMRETTTTTSATTTTIEKMTDFNNVISWKTKGTELEPFDGEISNEEKKYFRDNYFQVEYPIQVLKNLQSIEWRRVDFEFTIGSLIQSRDIHIIVVKKEVPFSVDGLISAGDKCIDFVCNLLKLDEVLTHKSPVTIKI